MDKDNDLKLVDSGNWFHTLITRSEKNTALDLCMQFFVQFERVTACLSSWFHSKKVIEFKYSEINFLGFSCIARCYTAQWKWRTFTGTVAWQQIADFQDDYTSENRLLVFTAIITVQLRQSTSSRLLSGRDITDRPVRLVALPDSPASRPRSDPAASLSVDRGLARGRHGFQETRGITGVRSSYNDGPLPIHNSENWLASNLIIFS